MINIDFSSVEIQKTFITGVFSILNTIIAAFTAASVGKYFANRRKLEEKLETAINDIHFLLEVEKIHCENNKQQTGQSLKNTFRELARNSGISFSGKFTPGQLR